MASGPETTSLVHIHSAAVNVSHFSSWKIVFVGTPPNTSLPLLGWNGSAHRAGETHCPPKIAACLHSGAYSFPPLGLSFKHSSLIYKGLSCCWTHQLWWQQEPVLQIFYLIFFRELLLLFFEEHFQSFSWSCPLNEKSSQSTKKNRL